MCKACEVYWYYTDCNIKIVTWSDTGCIIYRSRNVKTKQTKQTTPQETKNCIPLLLSIPPTAYRVPTVDFLGLVLGLCIKVLLSGNR